MSMPVEMEERLYVLIDDYLVFGIETG